MSRFSLLFQIVSKLRSTLLGQVFLTTATNAPDSAHKEIRKSSGTDDFFCFWSFHYLGARELGSNPINRVQAASGCCFLQSSVQRVWYFKEMTHNFSPVPL